MVWQHDLCCSDEAVTGALYVHTILSFFVDAQTLFEEDVEFELLSGRVSKRVFRELVTSSSISMSTALMLESFCICKMHIKYLCVFVEKCTLCRIPHATRVLLHADIYDMGPTVLLIFQKKTCLNVTPLKHLATLPTFGSTMQYVIQWSTKPT